MRNQIENQYFKFLAPIIFSRIRTVFTVFVPTLEWNAFSSGRICGLPVTAEAEIGLSKELLKMYETLIAFMDCKSACSDKNLHKAAGKSFLIAECC
jgi:hypothetical protein